MKSKPNLRYSLEITVSCGTCSKSHTHKGEPEDSVVSVTSQMREATIALKAEGWVFDGEEQWCSKECYMKWCSEEYRDRL